MSKPTLGLIMLVRDEADLIGPNLRFHHRQGFDRFVIVDNASKDGTREELDSLTDTLPMTIVSQPDTGYWQAEWTTGLARILDAEGIDWAISLDADEFVSSAGGGLKHLLANIEHPVLCRRENVLPVDVESRQPFYHPLMDSHLRVAKPLGPFPFDAPSLAFPMALRSMPGKVLFPLRGLVTVLAGNHRVEHEQRERSVLDALLIRHYPVRSFGHFMRRLDHWEERFQRNPPSGSRSVHIRYLLRMRRQGLIEKAYDALSVPVADVQRYLAQGTIVEDSFGRSLF